MEMYITIQILICNALKVYYLLKVVRILPTQVLRDDQSPMQISQFRYVSSIQDMLGFASGSSQD